MSKKENIKLDETIKLLFNVSDPLIIKIVNYFFQEELDVNQDYNVEFINVENVSMDMSIMKADHFIKIDNKHRFHFEFQLNQDSTMILRMFEYGLKDAMRNLEENNGMKSIVFPKQVVFYLEEKSRIPNKLKLQITFPTTDKGEQTIIYVSNVKKAWEINKEEMLDEGLYSLLPLEIFKMRREIEKIKVADEEEFKKIAETIKLSVLEIVDIVSEQRDKGRITEEDYSKITDASVYLLGYFSRKYVDLKLSREVSEVSEYIHERGKKEGIMEGKKEGIKEGKKESAAEIAKRLKEMGIDPAIIKRATDIEN